MPLTPDQLSTQLTGIGLRNANITQLICVPADPGDSNARGRLQKEWRRRLEVLQQKERPDESMIALCQVMLDGLDEVGNDETIYSWKAMCDGKARSGFSTEEKVIFFFPEWFGQSIPGKQPMSKRTAKERALKKDEIKDIQLSVVRGYKELKLDPKKSTPEEVQLAIRDLVDSIFLKKKKVTKRQKEDLGVNLGCLWGQTICETLKWEWCYVTISGEGECYAIATPNRSHCIAPMNFILTQLEKKLPEENTSMLLFNMLKGNKLQAADAKAYITIG